MILHFFLKQNKFGLYKKLYKIVKKFIAVKLVSNILIYNINNKNNG